MQMFLKEDLLYTAVCHCLSYKLSNVNEDFSSERVTDLQCHTQNTDGIFHLLMDVLLHQLLTHPQTQAAHSNAPEWRGVNVTFKRNTL